jgi:benzoyl-CoA reductase/2-hydroxyglutaryl-CoA dehydratase subunit BcrC/BadD/HgdB
MKKIGYLCTYTPKELIWAAGFLPVRILADNQAISLANSHLQSYSCSQARGCLEKMLRGELNLHAVVFTRCCDTLMRLADIWEKNSEMKVYNLEFPTKVDESSVDFFKKELYDFKVKLEEWAGRKISNAELVSSIKLYSQLEKILKEIFEIQPDYDLILKAETENPIEVLGEAKKRLEKLEKNLEKPLAKKRVLVTGSVCFPEILQLIGDAGFSVTDDLCTGTRFFTFKAGEFNGKDAIDFLARKYFDKAPCPTKSFADGRRFEYFLERVKAVDAVIFLLLKFCDPHFFDYPQLREKIEEMGKRTFLLELEFPVSIERLRTRIEAFYETL